MLSVTDKHLMLSVIMLNVVVLSVVMLSVVAPFQEPNVCRQGNESTLVGEPERCATRVGCGITYKH